MRTLLPAFLAGMILLYFVDAALKLDNFNWEMMAHNGIRFVTGFVFLGVLVWYKHQLKFKTALYIIITLLLLDHLFDYIRQVDSVNPQMMIHDSVVLLWGAVIGFIFVKSLRKPAA